jgi:hypothetical protein
MLGEKKTGVGKMVNCGALTQALIGTTSVDPDRKCLRATFHRSGDWRHCPTPSLGPGRPLFQIGYNRFCPQPEHCAPIVVFNKIRLTSGSCRHLLSLAVDLQIVDCRYWHLDDRVSAVPYIGL